MSNQIKNSAKSFVATAPSPATTGTSLVVSSGHGARFPTVPFNATVWPAGAIADTNTNAEIVRVTAIVGDTLTIVRQRESTAARTILVGDQIAQLVTKELLEVFETYVNAKVLGLSGTGDETTTLQALITASLGKQLYIPNGIYTFAGPLTIDGAELSPIRIFGDGVDALGGTSGKCTKLMCTGAGNGIEIDNDSSPFQVGLQRVTLEDFCIQGDGTDASGGNGIHAISANNLQLKNMWVRLMRGHGIYLDTCFLTVMDNVVLNRNRRCGLYSAGALHDAELRNIRAYSNGRIYIDSGSDQNANIFIDDATGGNYALRLSNTDDEGAGNDPFTAYLRSDNSLTSIAVASNVATITTAAAHGRTTGEKITIRGATVDPELNNTPGYIIQSTPTTQTFTINTVGVSDGTYTESTLFVGPWVPGLWLGSSNGAVIENYYFEGGTSGVAYITSLNNAVNYVGGYFQDGVIFLDGLSGGSIRGAYFFGTSATSLAGIITVAPTNVRSQIDISGSNTFGANSFQTRPTVYKQDGEYFSSAAPASGTWAVGDRVWNTVPASAQPPGWICTSAGSPGTWTAMANLA